MNSKCGEESYKIMIEKISPPVTNDYKVLIIGGTTDGATNFFTGVDLTSIKGRPFLIKSMSFVPKFLANSGGLKELQIFDETGGGQNFDIVSPQTANPGLRVITSNIDFNGVGINFKINGKRLDFILGLANFVPFDSRFEKMNIYFNEALQDMDFFATGLIYSNVTTGATSFYFLQVIFELLINPSNSVLLRLH
jgi:hypothetical protein